MQILQPITIRGMTLKNRVIMSPMDVGLGLRSRRAIAYYVERARGGVGAIICGILMVGALISDEAWGKPGAAAAFISGIKTLADEVHRAGTRIGLQLSHPFSFPGTVSMFDKTGKPIAPSPRIEPDPPRHPALTPGTELREITVAEIKEISRRFARGAAVVKEAGFDFVELHGANGHFLSTFFSPRDNRRTDEYGGDLKRRMRLPLETLTAMRAAVGESFPIFYRLGAEDVDIPDGVKPADAASFARELEKAGADVIDVASNSYIGVHPLPDEPMGTFAYLAAAVKRKVKVPVSAVGRINTPEAAEAILRDGKADLVNIGRQLIADAHWVEKVAGGRAEEIIPCIGCMHCHAIMYHQHQPAECAVNPSSAKETEFQVTPAVKRKKVTVIGGGPAGMEAALIAAQRGHTVTLLEKGNRLGGQLLSASLPPHKEDIARFNEYLVRQVNRSAVTVRLNTETTVDGILAAKPDAVILATGAKPLVPEISGAHGENVRSALDVLSGETTGQRVVIVGGGMIGSETALFLAGKGRQVQLLEMLDGIGRDVEDDIVRRRLIRGLRDAAVAVHTGTAVTAITEHGVSAVTQGARREFPADTVVIATGMCPEEPFQKELAGKVPEIYAVGDCAAPRKIAGAVHDGARVAREL